MKIEKLSGGLWVPSTDAQIEQWREKGTPHMQETGLNRFVQWCDSQHKKFNLILDIGAWCGTWSMEMQKYAKNIHCYEPNKIHYECLTRNLAPYNHVRFYNQAIGNDDGFVKLTEESATQNTRVLMEKGETKINKLDSLDTTGIDMIKIDVEGLEMEVLKGASSKLNTIEYIMIELNNNTERYGTNKREVHSYLNDLGFKVLFKTWPDLVYYKA